MRNTSLVLMLAVLSVPEPCPAQTAAVARETLSGNAAARAVVGRALDVMGGPDRLGALDATRRVSTFELRNPWQGARPVAGGYGPVIESGRERWTHDARNHRALIETAGTIYGGQPYSRRGLASPDGGFIAHDSTRRADSLSPAAAAAMLASLERELPETLLTQLWDRRHRLQWLGESDTEARVAFGTDDGRMLVLVFDKGSGLLLRQEQLADHAALGDYVHRIRYEDWRQVGDVRLPFRHTEESASSIRVRTIRSLSRGIPVDDARLEAPAGYAGPRPAGRDSTLGRGVHLVAGAYNALLIEFDSFFVAVEPSPGTRAALRVMARAAELRPGKPIRYVVVTHFHDDHLGGIRPFIAAGATVITTAHGAEAVRAIAEVRKGMYPDTLDANPRKPVVSIVSDRRVIEDATQRLEIRSIGSSPHAEQMLVVWLPASRVLYEADVLDLDVPPDGIPMPGADTRHFGEWLERAKLDVSVIVPTHGRIGGIRDLERALRR